MGATPGSVSQGFARRFGATAIMSRAGIFELPAVRARAFAAALRRAGSLSFAEPDRSVVRKGYPQDPGTQYQWYLGYVADDLTPPPVTSTSPVLAVIDDQVDLTHPEWTGDPNIRVALAGADTEGHGTAVAAVAGAPANGQGIVGVWPGMRIFSYAAPDCGGTVRAIDQAIRDRVSVINMSYGFDVRGCFSHLVATQEAFGFDIALVAAGGNEFQQGDMPSRPAADPHVLSVAAVNPDGSSSSFSNEGSYIDLSAPGAAILSAIPLRFDTDDGSQDGYTFWDGTSFSSPITAAAAAWIRAVRPRLENGQVYDALRFSAVDLGSPGWDRRFGFGLLSIARALGQAVPPPDPLEPNDDIEWIDGERFGDPDAPIFRAGSRRRTIDARLDQLEDPVDVYRVTMPPRSRLRISVRPVYGDPDLEAYSGGAATVYSNFGRLAASTRSGKRTDRITVVNRRRTTRRIYVDTYVSTDLRGLLNARYRLTVQRVRFSG